MECLALHDSLIHVVLTAAAPDHVENGADGHASTNRVANPVFKIGEGQRRAENVKQGLDPERVYKCAIFMDIADLQDNAQEKECEEAIVPFDYDRVQVKFIVSD